MQHLARPGSRLVRGLLAALLAVWFAQQVHAREAPASDHTHVFARSIQDALVAFNVESKKVHKLSCPSARQCTVNCITIRRSEARERGGVACKRCGG